MALPALASLTGGGGLSNSSSASSKTGDVGLGGHNRFDGLSYNKGIPTWLIGLAVAGALIVWMKK